MSQQRPTLAFIGAGKVAQTVARLWAQQGYAINAIASRTPAHAQALAEQVQAPVTSIEEAASSAELVCLAVADDAIQPVAASLAELDWQGRALIHFSGAHSIGTLQNVAQAGAMVGGLHPAFPFADVEQSIENLPGAAFAIEARDETLRGWLYSLVASIEGHIIDIPPGQKAIYHAALCIASNYTVTLYSIAQDLLAQIGADTHTSQAALHPLLMATLHNIVQTGIPDALTGPLSRADTHTIEAHLKALEEQPQLADTYRNLARLSYPMLAARHVPFHEIESLLQRTEQNAPDDT
ncbi:DUF2520 domain-containing protein [Phototrophicus methaneseepsis]|uniref:DUF2520 domain-containing protein n=1 Tax=Phototrophicus methaneseepsis TaxID=2710758 RepID=A0A7S8ICK9_9CHLR|nr:DUF2520 domain-containing protein [Phototrophicus methaneseepsis]QPC81660.1 DUF2520 domain-containing protein [Phototrophicus methaneseepsis]